MIKLFSMRKRRRAGQSTIEYAIIFVVIVAAILAFLSKAFKPRMEEIYTKSGNKMNESFLRMDQEIGFKSTSAGNSMDNSMDNSIVNP